VCALYVCMCMCCVLMRERVCMYVCVCVCVRVSNMMSGATALCFVDRVPQLRDEKGFLFIDRDYQYFGAILSFLRTGVRVLVV
jgi:BTB/POZ domain